MLFQQRFNEILLIGPIQNGVNEVGVVLESVYREDARDAVEIYMVIICVFVKILLFISLI